MACVEDWQDCFPLQPVSTMARGESVSGVKTDDSFQFIPCLQMKVVVRLGKNLTVHVIELERQGAGTWDVCWHLGFRSSGRGGWSNRLTVL